MSTRKIFDFRQFKSESIRLYDNVAGYRNDAYEELEKSRAKKLVNRMCKTETELIRNVIDSRNLDEMIALEFRLQNNDLENYARTPHDIESVEQGLKDFQRGVNSYDTLRNDPEQYRKNAEEFTDRNRDMRLDVPKDGMRYALSSQMTRLQNRQSLQLSDEEKELLTARRGLVTAIRNEYSLLQENVVHGRIGGVE